MKFLQVIKLLLDTDAWESSNRGFSDELQTKDKTIRFYSYEAVRFRNLYSEIVYDVNFLAWIVILPLSRRLKRIVKQRESNQP